MRRQAIALVEAQLDELCHQELVRWQHIALLLLRAKDQKLWRSRARSFSSWLNDRAGRLARDPDNIHAKRRILWSCLIAGDFYRELRRRHPTLPPLGKAPATPQTLELARKIVRWAPGAVAAPLALRAAKGEIGRLKLQQIWRQYQPSIRRKQRGPGKELRAGDVDQERQRRADLLTCLREHPPNVWLGKDGSRTELHADVPIDGAPRVDAVMLIEGGTWAGVHAIVAAASRGSLEEANALWRTGLAPCWMLVPAKLEIEAAPALPADVGVLVVRADGRVVIRKEATLARPAAALPLALALLRRLQGWEVRG